MELEGIQTKNQFIYLEVKSLITIEHQHKSSQLMTKSFHGFRLASASRTYMRANLFNSDTRPIPHTPTVKK